MVIKKYLMKNIGNYFLPYLSVYRAFYSTQHDFLRFIEEWKTNMEDNFVVGAELVNLSKAFSLSIFHNLLITKLAGYRF